MIGDLSQVRIFVRPGTTDMRKQINGLAALVRDGLAALVRDELAALVRDELAHNPLDGSLYLFAGIGGRRLKILYWDRNGFCLWQKRLEEDHFPWPREAGQARSITRDQLRLLLDGIDFWRAHQRRDYKNL